MAKGLCDRQLSRGKTTDKHEEKKSSELNYWCMLMDNLKNIKLKKPDTKAYTLYGSIYMKCLERANL